jgi:nucleoside-diphosphate-sugar epimerase
MKVLLTGTTGLLGSEIIRQLKTYPDIELFSLVRSNEQEKLFYNSILADILDYPSLLVAMTNIDVVIHAAAKVSFSPKEKNELFETNVEGTANIVNACLEKGVRRLIYISSVAAIGRPETVIDAGERIFINERNTWQDSPANSEYGKSKYHAEQEVWRGQAEGLQTVILNPSVIIGESQWSQSSTRLFKYVYERQRFYTDGLINYVDVRDVAGSVIKLIKSKQENTRYILSAGCISYKAFFSLIAKHLNTEPPKYKLGGLAIKILWRLEALRAFLFRSNPLITKETSLTARAKIEFDNSKAKNELGIEFTPLDTSVKRVCEYLLKEHSGN